MWACLSARGCTPCRVARAGTKAGKKVTLDRIDGVGRGLPSHVFQDYCAGTLLLSRE